MDVAFVRPPFLDDGISMVTVLTEERYIAVHADHPSPGATTSSRRTWRAAAPRDRGRWTADDPLTPWIGRGAGAATGRR